MTSGPAIVIDALVKRYGAHVAVDGLDLTVPSGIVFGFLGPNGAGKTTTIRTMLDLLRPTRGRIEVFGLDSRRDSLEVRRRTGYVPGELALYETLTGAELLAHVGGLRGGVDPRWQAELVERFDADLDRPIRQLSRGNKQKLGLIQAFAHRPDLLLLDEPTSGLDPLVQEEFHRLLAEVSSAGQTVFLSSHILSEVQHLASRVAVISKGQLVINSDVATLRERAPRKVEVVFATPIDASVLAGVSGLSAMHVEGRTLRCVITGRADGLVKALAPFDVDTLTVAEPELEDVFLDLYRVSGPSDAEAVGSDADH